MAVWPRTNRGKALQLAYWNADGVYGRKLELEQFLREHGIDICHLNETRLESCRALSFMNYVCHQLDRPTRGGGTVIDVRRGIDQYAVPILSLQHLEATAIHLVLATRPVKFVVACLLPTWPLIELDLTECLSRGFPILMVADLNAKHKDWNSRLITATGSFLRDYANRNSCLICGLDSPTTAPYTRCYPRRPWYSFCQGLCPTGASVCRFVCSALSFDHLPILIDTTCQSSFQNLLDLPDVMRMDWSAF
jgi:hypothetical protein